MRLLGEGGKGKGERLPLGTQAEGTSGAGRDRGGEVTGGGDMGVTSILPPEGTTVGLDPVSLVRDNARRLFIRGVRLLKRKGTEARRAGD